MDTVILLAGQWEAVVAAVVAVLVVWRLITKNEGTQKALDRVISALEIARSIKDGKGNKADDVIATIAAEHMLLKMTDPFAANALSDAVRVADPKKRPRNFMGHLSDIIIGPAIKGFVASKLGSND